MNDSVRSAAGAEPAVGLRARGALASLSAAAREALRARPALEDPAVTATVCRVLAAVATRGDAAVAEFAREFDGGAPESFEVPRAACDAALAALDPALGAALDRAARNIAAAHRAQLPEPVECETEPGVVVGRRPDPLARAGLYVPGGRAVYPSSVLMGAIPARLAGVGSVIACCAPRAGGGVDPVLLAACALAGVDRVFAIGGAQAIAAMAYGTASVPRVDVIVGPGNAFVAAAKQAVAAEGRVRIDSPAGPSELVLIADDSADPAQLAREMVAQAEHDPQAAVVALCLGDALARALDAALDVEVATTPRSDIVREALARAGAILEVSDVDSAIAFANEFAPEHLLLALAAPEEALAASRHAGTVFVGASSSVAFGDYMSGANHVLPTSGHARLHSGLSVHDFLRWTAWQRITPPAAARIGDDVARIATAEGLPGHAAAAAAWSTAAAPVATTPPLNLADNTSLFGTSPAARRALRDAGDAITAYPSPDNRPLRRALADKCGVALECVLIGSGSDDILDAAMRALAAPGDTIAYGVPTFSMIPLFARANRLACVEVPLRAGGALDVEALVAAAPRLLYVCAPNNPTGTPVAPAVLARLLAETDATILLDRAYAEFDHDVFAPALLRAPRVIEVRTLSKAWGLAGLRVGYAIASPPLVAALDAVRAPYRIGGASERAACAALAGDGAWVRDHAEKAVAARTALVPALRALGFAPLESHANFVLIPVGDATRFAAALAARGVLVRAFPALPMVGDAIRVTVGPPAAMQRLLDALTATLAEVTA